MTTHVALRGDGHEANPLMRGVLNAAGPVGLYAVKLALLGWTYREMKQAPRGSPAAERAVIPIVIMGIMPTTNNLVVLLTR